MDQSTLYDEDVYAWAEQQAQALRRLARTDRNLPNELDLEHVIEEIEDVGNSERNAAESFIRLILVHLIKLISVPESAARQHWRAEIIGFHIELLQHLTPSMHHRIDVALLWARALRQASAALEAEGDALAVDKLRGCTLSVGDFASEQFDIERAIASLTNAE